MSDQWGTLESPPLDGDNRRVNRRLKLTVTFVVAVMLVAVVWVGLSSPSSRDTRPPTSSTITTPPQYSLGVVNPSDPSGLGPIAASGIPGYIASYVNDFNGASLPPVWHTFGGIPGGDPTGQFGNAHVIVRNGLLQLNTWRDPAFHNKWVTGGLCLCDKPQTYGAFFVRSRQTGSGPNEVELLWPKNNSWPPEIDFNESGGATYATSATVHWTRANHQLQSLLQANLTQWHTWGVIWTPQSIKYTLDGRVWASDTEIVTIPTIPMTIDLEQRTVCNPLSQCPTRPTSLLIDWVAQFAVAPSAR